jgi:AraC-like DNA-binding protein
MLHSAIIPVPEGERTSLLDPTRMAWRMRNSDLVNLAPTEPVEFVLGGYAVYYSRHRRYALDRGCGWETGQKLLLVQPYCKHRLVRRHDLRTILIEPESVCARFMDDDRWVEGTQANRSWLARIERGFEQWETETMVPARSIDHIVFGETLLSRELDRRIAAVVRRIVESPCDPDSNVVVLAREVGLSSSRLSHLFREQLGVSIRSFRAWKRARNSIFVAAKEPVMLRAALDAGYADEAHYCRSIKKYFGVQANAMRHHWRRSMAFRDTAESPVLQA